jgi:hypothetical protein
VRGAVILLTQADHVLRRGAGHAGRRGRPHRHGDGQPRRPDDPGCQGRQGTHPQVPANASTSCWRSPSPSTSTTRAPCSRSSRRTPRSRSWSASAADVSAPLPG